MKCCSNFLHILVTTVYFTDQSRISKTVSCFTVLSTFYCLFIDFLILTLQMYCKNIFKRSLKIKHVPSFRQLFRNKYIKKVYINLCLTGVDKVTLHAVTCIGNLLTCPVCSCLFSKNSIHDISFFKLVELVPEKA